jgi:hypothetical protein
MLVAKENTTSRTENVFNSRNDFARRPPLEIIDAIITADTIENVADSP